MRESVEFYDVPPRDARIAVCEWLRHHGIDPAAVPVPCTLVRCEDTRRIWYPEVVRDEHGNPTPSDDGLLIRQRVLQLEAVPSPFPKLGARGHYIRRTIFDPRLYDDMTGV